MDTGTVSNIIEFLVQYKWWIFALVPFAIGIMVIRGRG